MPKLSYLEKLLAEMRLQEAIALDQERLPPEERPVQYVSVKEASSLLQVSQRSLRRWIKSGELRAYWVGRHNMLRIRWSDIHHMLQRADVAPLPKRKRRKAKAS